MLLIAVFKGNQHLISQFYYQEINNMEKGSTHGRCNIVHDQDAEESSSFYSSLESLSCDKVQICTNDPHNVDLRNGIWESLEENPPLQSCENSENQNDQEVNSLGNQNQSFEDDPFVLPIEISSPSHVNQFQNIFENVESPSEIETLPSDSANQGHSMKFQKLIFEPKKILNQNNNYPKLLLNRFYDYLEKQELYDDQRVELSNIFQELCECQFKKAGLKHFRQLFHNCNSQLSNRRHLHTFLTGPTFRQAILKSKAIREVVKKNGEKEGLVSKPKNNKIRYLLGAKMGILRSRSRHLAIRIQTTRNNSY